ncbi:hypothetical protein [Haladaptatus sp. NG-WS-4]
MTPRSSPLSRRAMLAAGTALATTAIAGCSGQAESSSADCETAVVSHGDPDVLQTVMVVPDGDDAQLRIHLVDGAPESTDRLRVYDSSGELEHEIPTDDRRTYVQHLGPRPTHGQFRVVSYDGEETDEMVVEFNCWVGDDSWGGSDS